MSTDVFHEPGYLAHNAARLEHLASLELPIEGRTVLELGAGVGSHTPFFLERGCKVTVTDGRPENVARMKAEHPDWDVWLLDVEESPLPIDRHHDIVYCYGLLYHTADPIAVLRTIAALKPQLLLLETCVSFGKHHIHFEDKNDPRCALRGQGNRLPREVIRRELIELFDHVYMPLTQPAHEEFPLDWNDPGTGECRAIFIASTEKLENPLLATYLPTFQTRYAN